MHPTCEGPFSTATFDCTARVTRVVWKDRCAIKRVSDAPVKLKTATLRERALWAIETVH